MQVILLSSPILLLAHPSHLPHIVKAPTFLLGGLASHSGPLGLQFIHWKVLKQISAVS